jgi:predicted glycosyltransferase
MRVLLDIGHPAHVHLFKNPRKILLEHGHEVFVIARDKEIARYLLEAYKIEYFPGTKQRSGLGAGIELIEWFWKVFRLIGKLQIDLVASIGSPGGAWAAKLRGIPHLAFNDTETAPWQRALYYPASIKVYTPECLLIDFGSKQIRYKGLHDLSYLRPEHFTPNPSVKEELGLHKDEEYVILRFVSWNATHDLMHKKTGTDTKRKIIDIAIEKYRIFISAEGELPPDLMRFKLILPPHRLHDALAFASMVISDGSTTATEAAVLGTPSIYISPFAHLLGYNQFLKKYDLIYEFKTFPESIGIIEKIIEDPQKVQRMANRKKFLEDTIDVAIFIANQIEKYGKR